MRTKRLIFIFLAVLLSVGCSKKKTVEYDKKQALENYTICRHLADEWLKKLDSSNYSHVLSIQSTIRSANDTTDLEISSKIADMRIEYGKIVDRTFMGSHIYFYSNQSLLTYLPDIEDKYLAFINAGRAEDDFYIVQPKNFGLKSYKQMFTWFPQGDYVILMYKTIPSNKSYAEERLTLGRPRWNNPDGSWQVVDYKIADDI